MKTEMNFFVRKILRFSLGEFISNDFLVELAEFTKLKLSTSNSPDCSESYIFQFLKVSKYVLLHISFRRGEQRSEVATSLPYYTKDAVLDKADVEILTNMKMGIFDAVKVYITFFSLALFFPKFKDVRAQMVGAITMAAIYYKCLTRNVLRKVHFYRYAFVPEVAILVYLLAEDQSIEVHFYESGSFVNQGVIIKTNVLHHTNPFSSGYAKHFSNLYVAKKFCSERSEEDIVRKFEENPEIRNTIGIFSSGMYCREAFDKYNEHIISAGEVRENEMLAALKEYAIKNPDIEFTIYPHYARGVETYEGAQAQYSDFSALSNVSISKPGFDLSQNHNGIGLGVTVISYVFWDRLFRGCKTVLFDPHHNDHFVENTSLHNIRLKKDDHNISEKITHFHSLPKIDYIKLLFEADERLYS